MKRPSFSAVAVESARRDPDAMSLELNLIDGRSNSQNLTLSNTAITHLLAAVFQKRMQDPTKDFFLNEAIPISGVGVFDLPSGHLGLRLYLNPTEVFDVSFAPDVQRELQVAFQFLANGGAADA